MEALNPTQLGSRWVPAVPAVPAVPDYAWFPRNLDLSVEGRFREIGHMARQSSA